MASRDVPILSEYLNQLRSLPDAEILNMIPEEIPFSMIPLTYLEELDAIDRRLCYRACLLTG
ncbi:hypothetical protein C0995_006173, partial [Termitomyces sp. Mi166